MGSVFHVFIFIASCVSFQIRVLKSGALNFAPFLKVHHVLLLEPERKDQGFYVVDFSPLNQTQPKTMLHLALGKWVPAEIRIRYIPSSKNDDEILEHWHFLNQDRSPNDSLTLSRYTANLIKDLEIKRWYKYIESSWKTEMNLYTHNCQHFVRDRGNPHHQNPRSGFQTSWPFGEF